MTTSPAAARVSGTITALEFINRERDYWIKRAESDLAHQDMLERAYDYPLKREYTEAMRKADEFNAFLAAIQPDPEPQPVSQAALQPDQNISPICQPKPVAESITPVERLFLIKIAMTGTDADFRRYRYRFAKALRATPSSAGTVSVEAAIQLAQKFACEDVGFEIALRALAGEGER